MEVLGINKHYVILDLKNGANQWNILDELKKLNVDIKTFGAYEPSLNDIFVSRVGEEETEPEDENKIDDSSDASKKKGFGRMLGKGGR